MLISGVASVHIQQARADAAALLLAQLVSPVRPPDPDVDAAKSNLADAMARVHADRAGLSFLA
jgi:hypothetical protein